jgi:transcriptional regulator GlxA family with amidase domain
MPRNVAIVLFEDVEVLDFAGPFEIFSMAGLRHEGGPPFNVYTVAERREPVRAHMNLIVTPNYSFGDCPPPDVLVVPGGNGSRKEMRNPAMLEWVSAQDVRTELTMSVCTGALILATAGLLAGRSATTHFGSYDLLQELSPSTKVVRGVRFVDEGGIVTSAGIQAGMDMSLHLVSRLAGEDIARNTARIIEYQWEPEWTAASTAMP